VPAGDPLQHDKVIPLAQWIHQPWAEVRGSCRDDRVRKAKYAVASWPEGIVECDKKLKESQIKKIYGSYGS